MRYPTIIAVAASISCVPAGDEDSPRGAVGIDIHLSEATRGKTFESRDGHTITIERFALLLRAQSQTFGVTRGGERVLFRALPEGLPLLVSLPADFDHPRADWSGWSVFDARAREQFGGAGLESPTPTQPHPPSMVVAVQATKGGRTIRFDAALTPYVGGALFCTRKAAGRNALTIQDVDVKAEALFSVGGEVRFDSFARADRDGDGTISSEELMAGGIDAEERDDAAALAERTGCADLARSLGSPSLFKGRPAVSSSPLDLLLVRAQKALLVQEP